MIIPNHNLWVIIVEPDAKLITASPIIGFLDTDDTGATWEELHPMLLVHSGFGTYTHWTSSDPCYKYEFVHERNIAGKLSYYYSEEFADYKKDIESLPVF